MAQEFTREKLSAADAFGNPVYIGSDKTTIHTVPANSQDTITLYLKFGRTARCEVTLFRSDGTNDYELPNKYLGASGSIVPVEITNVQAGNTIKAQLSGASPNTTIYVSSGEKASNHVQAINRNSTYEIAIYDNKFQTGTPKYLTVDDFNWGAYTAPTSFTYLKAFKYFPDTGHLAMCISSSTGAGWWVHDIYENKVVFFSSAYQHGNTQYGSAWMGDKFVFVAGNTPIYVVDFTDRANPTLTSTAVSQVGNYGYGMAKVSGTVFATISSDGSYPISTWKLNSDNTVTYVATDNSPAYCYEVWAADTFADGNFYLAYFSNGGSYYGGLLSIDGTTGAITSISNSINSPFNSTYTYKVVACPERNEFWMFRNSNGSYDIGKITTAGTITSYTNSRDIAEKVTQGRCFYDATDDLIYVMSNDNKWYGWDPDTQIWQKDGLIFADYQWAGQNSQVHSLGVINNGTNNMLYGEYGSGNATVLRNLDTGSEHIINHGISTASNDYHTASGRIYSASTANNTPYIHVARTTGTPTTEQNYYPPSYAGFSSYLYSMQVDQVNDKLYYSDYYSSLFRAGINSTNGQLTYEAEVINLSTTTYRSSQWIVDPVGQKWYVFHGSGILVYDMSTSSTSPTSYAAADLGITSGLPSYSSNFNFQSALDSNSIYQGQCGPAYDQANNIAYLSCYYYTGASYKSGVIKLDLSQVGVSTSSTYAGFASFVNNTARVIISRHISNGKLIAGTSSTNEQKIITVSDMSTEAVSPVYATSGTYGRLYDSGTNAVYFSDPSYKSEAQKYNAPAGEMPVASDFQVLTKGGYNNNTQVLYGSLGSHTHSDPDYSESTSAQRAALDLSKGNSTTGHVNRVTTTA